MISCTVCLEDFQTSINYLSEPIDVYSEWIDACESANAWQNTFFWQINGLFQFVECVIDPCVQVCVSGFVRVGLVKHMQMQSGRMSWIVFSHVKLCGILSSYVVFWTVTMNSRSKIIEKLSTPNFLCWCTCLTWNFENELFVFYFVWTTVNLFSLEITLTQNMVWSIAWKLDMKLLDIASSELF